MTVVRRVRRMVAAWLALLFLVGGSGLGPRVHLHGHDGQAHGASSDAADADAASTGESVRGEDAVAPAPAIRASASSCHGGAAHGHGSHESGDSCTCIGSCHVGSAVPLVAAVPSVARSDHRQRVHLRPSIDALAIPSPTRHLPPLPNGPPAFL